MNDLLDLLPNEDRGVFAEPITPVSEGRVVGFTMSETDVDALAEFEEVWHTIHRNAEGGWRRFRGWHPSWTGSNALGSAHESNMFLADLRCEHNRRDDGDCECVGSLLYRVYCHGCTWWSEPQDGENAAAEVYLDHCWPGWRDLPTTESVMKSSGGYEYYLPEDYPAQWTVPGAPARDCRGLSKYLGRHVPGYNQFGGYKVAVAQPCERHNQP